jgi:hypothetical protein
MLAVSQYHTSKYTTEAVTKTTWYWHKTRPKYQWNKIEDPEIKLHSHSHLVFDKREKTASL